MTRKTACAERPAATELIGSYHYASDEMSSITHVVEGTGVLNHNRALYDSMVFAGFANDQAAYIEFRAYDQQRSYGMNNTNQVPNVPGRMSQKK